MGWTGSVVSPPRKRPSRPRLPADVDAQIDRALAEDRADDDRTSRAVLLRGLRTRAIVVAQARGVASGIALGVRLLRRAGLTARARIDDGDEVRPGTIVLETSGPAGTILAVERTLLNYLMHLSGIATRTHAAVRAGGGALTVYATRKTTPGLRDLEKAAVVHGGGRPHRRDLAAQLLVKTPHLDLVGLRRAVVAARTSTPPGRPVQVEVHDLPSAALAVELGASSILIDNASPAVARAIVRGLERRGLRHRAWIELSGGITPENVARYRRTGADAVSLGSITHSAPALPYHLVVRPVRARRASR
jgi:nicotinate-nucleotide pyrophosphorylase (carboxylating)